jgi:hypothetical protein
MLWHKIQGAGGFGVGGGLNMGDFMNSTTYVGNATTARAITTGIDLSTGEGMIWVAASSGEVEKPICDTNMGATNYLVSSGSNTRAIEAEALQSFDSDGFTIGDWDDYNKNAVSFVAWTFKSEPGVFDCLEYTGTAAAQNIAHALGEVPGAIIIKTQDGAGSTDMWNMYHRSLNGGTTPEDYFVELSKNIKNEELDTNAWNSTAPTASVFSVGATNDTNTNGDTYSAYIFPHNDNVQCGTYTGNGSTTGPTVTLGFEPQWLFIKGATQASSAKGLVWDNVRNPSNPRTNASQAWKRDADFTSGYDVDFNATGFQIKNTQNEVNTSGDTYVYIAIRKAD